MPRALRKLTFLLLAALLLAAAGCAYRQAVQQGDAYAEQGKWQAAYAEYEEAQERRPDSEDLRKKLQEARLNILKSKLAQARAAIEAERWELALEHLDGARYYSRDDGLLEAGYDDLSEAMLQHVDAAVDEGDMTAAYRRADRMRELLGGSASLASRSAELRDHFFTRADALADRGDWERALDALSAIEKWGSPDGEASATLDRKKGQIRAAWAEEARSDARRHADAGHPGAALARYLRAWEIAKRSDDRRAARRLANELRRRQTARVSLRADARSEAAATRAIQNTLEGRLAGRDTLRLVRDATDDTDIRLAIDATRQSCSESVVDTETHDKRYLESTYQVTNPEWERLERRQDRVCDASGPRHDRVRRTHEHAERHEREYRHIKHHELDDARRRVERLERRLRQCRYDSRRRHDNHDCSRHDRHDSRHDDCDWEERKLDRAERDYRRARRRVREAHREWHDAVDEHEDAEEELEELEDRCDDLQYRLRNTPRTVTRENWGTFRYRVEVHRRRCTTHVTYSLRGDGAEPRRHTVSSAYQTHDKAHPAHPGYDIAADRVSFSASRRSLIGRNHDDLADQLAEAVAGALREFYRRRTAAALDMLGPSPREATDRLVGLRLAAGDLLGKAQTSAIDSHLSSTYGTAALGKLE